jgi:transcriptional regulator with XRE-family HTH domain
MVAIRVDALDETIDRLETDLGLSTEELASALSASRQDIERWTLGKARPNAETRRRLDALLALYEHLHETFRPEGIPGWLRAPNRYIGSITKRQTTPAEAIVKGEFDWVEGALVVIDYGMFV